MRRIRGRDHAFSEKLHKPDHPMSLDVYYPFHAIVNVWTEHENFKADAVDLDY